MGDNLINNKKEARLSYANRKIQKWAKWSIENLGVIRYKDLMEQRKLYNLDK
jgi:hypothetical protein